ncbi:TetR/AcrR family transcriptional regulator [Sporichthya sp.]|uniref:TetR/AcrR family transcriptional regulator n=1 Tax=Sporichthya sp. TaxID=65475 RepID=UPI0017E18318|nr:TetR/AcrR family transcriptional regulator [Sporichthya sp.]MBA3744360.1 TetR/AcrR family transcriptional regulator [Sporichthya sp.]
MSPTGTPPRRRPRAHTGDQAIEKAVFAATEKLLATTPLHEISVAQIIAEAELSRASFYHYFSSKHDVVTALMTSIFEAMFAETHTELEGEWADPATALRSSLRPAMEAWFEHRAVISAVLENQHAVPDLAKVWSAVSEPFRAVLAAQITHQRAVGRAPDGLPAEVIASMMVSAAERIFYVGSTGTDPRLRTASQRLDATVAICMAAIYGDPRGPVSA